MGKCELVITNFLDQFSLAVIEIPPLLLILKINILKMIYLSTNPLLLLFCFDTSPFIIVF